MVAYGATTVPVATAVLVGSTRARRGAEGPGPAGSGASEVPVLESKEQVRVRYPNVVRLGVAR